MEENTTTKKHPLQDLLEEAGHECRSYSGRAMYGKECLGVDTERSLGTLIADVMEAMVSTVDMEDGHTVSACADAFRQMKTDSMGLGTIVYFPGVPFVADDEEETGEDQEEARAWEDKDE